MPLGESWNCIKLKTILARKRSISNKYCFTFLGKISSCSYCYIGTWPEQSIGGQACTGLTSNIPDVSLLSLKSVGTFYLSSLECDWNIFAQLRTLTGFFVRCPCSTLGEHIEVPIFYLVFVPYSRYRTFCQEQSFIKIIKTRKIRDSPVG